MKSILTLFSQSWNMLTRDKRSFFIVFLFQLIHNLLTVLVFWAGLGIFAVFLFSTDANSFLSQLSHSLDFLTTRAGMVIFVIACTVLIPLYLLFQVLFYYLSQKWLTYLFHKKKITFSFLISQWKWVWSWAGTWLSIFLYFIGFFVLCLVLALCAALINDFVVVGVFILWFLWFIFLWISLYLAIPGYFLDDKRYFLSAKNAFSLVRHRWWKTFGYVLVALICAAIVSLLFTLLEKIVGFGIRHAPETLTSSSAFGVFATIIYLLYAFVQLGINILVQIFLSAYSFQLYSFYKKNTPNTLK